MATITSLPVAATIDATADTFPIVTNSLNTTQQINRNTFLNLASQPVGLTDTQVLTNKTLTSPTINGATLSGTLSGTYTIGGTPTFPSSITQNTVSQTLTNKTLTSPTINSPTITNATISADTLTGYTTSNTGTIYGVPVTTGTISGNYLAANTVVSGKLGLSSGYTGGVQSFSNSGSAGGTFYYVNLGGIKLMWGLTGTITINAASVSANIAMPSFFTTVQGGYTTAGQNFISDTKQIAIFNQLSATGNTTLGCANVTGSTTSSASFFVYIIGT